MAWWRSLIRKRRRFADLPPAERALVLRALFLLLLVAGARRFVSFRRLRDWLMRLIPPAPPVEHDPLTAARRTAELVAAAAGGLPFTPNCLERSLVLWALLRARGIAGDLHFGVRRDRDRLDVHAWVEYSAVVLNDRADVGQRYTVITPS
ncbi:MAG: lasso peptide biosynthesis B2 protein [Candidatus Flexifilum sp.]